MFSYVSASSFVIQNMMGFSPRMFALVFATNAAGMMTSGFLNTRLLNHFSARAILTSALVTMLAANLTVLTCAFTNLPPVPFFLGLFFSVAPVSLVVANATTLDVDVVRTRAGSASSVIGFGQFLLSSLAASLVGHIGSTEAVGMAVCMVASISIALVAFAIVRRWASTS